MLTSKRPGSTGFTDHLNENKDTTLAASAQATIKKSTLLKGRVLDAKTKEAVSAKISIVR